MLPGRCLPTVGRVLDEAQVEEFAQQGYVVVPQVVPADVLTRARGRVDDILAADPPPTDVHGPHFRFLETRDEPDLLDTLTATGGLGLAEEVAGAGTLEAPWQVQVALNIPPFAHRPGAPHIDAANAEPSGGPVVDTFTMLAGVLLTDQLAEDVGNLWVWPGTHLAHARYFREHGPRMFCAYPPIALPEPVQVLGRAGDLLLAHYLLGHNIGGNFASDRTRQALYFRLSSTGHAGRQEEFLQDPWLEYAPLRAGR